MVVVIDTEKSTNPNALVVQNGTPLSSSVSPRCRTLINDFRMVGCKTFEHLVALGKTVVAAKVELPPKEYKYFSIQIGFKPDSPTLRKFECIGRNAANFEGLGNRMPNRWTTLYLIASLTPEQLDTLVSHKEFGPDIKAEKVREIVFPRQKTVQSSERPLIDLRNPPLEPEKLSFLAIHLHKVPGDRRGELLEEIERLQTRFLFRLVWHTDVFQGWREPPETSAIPA